MRELRDRWVRLRSHRPSLAWIRILLLAYGVGAAIWGVGVLREQIPDAAFLMEARSGPIRASIVELDRGGPLLWATGVDSCGSAGSCPVAPADDQGIFVFLPAAGHLLHVGDPFLLIKWFAVALTAFLMFVYPLVFYEIFGSLVVALAAPFVLLAKMSFVENTEVYFAMAWAVLLGLPALFALHGRTTKTARALLVLLVMAAALASTVRLHAGLPILLGALVSVWLTGESLKRRAILSVVLAAAYFPVVDIPFDVARYRDAVTGVPYSQVIEAQHGIWHSIYIGLGYLPNPYGITFNDNAGDVAAHRVKPDVVYATKDYQDTLRGVVLDLVRRDPGFVAANVAAKVAAAGVEAVDLLGPIGLVVPVMLLVGRRRRSLRALALIAVPAAALTFAVPILYVPFPQYEVGWLGTVGVIWMMAVGWIAAEAIGGVSAALSDAAALLARLAAWRDRVRGWLRRPIGVAIALALVVVLVAAGVAGYRAADRARLAGFYSQQSAGLASQADQPSVPVASWTFAAGLPAGWNAFAGVATQRAPGGLGVTTNAEPLAYQVGSPVLRLGPGRYAALVGGRVTAGGLYVGVLDARTSTWLSTRYYWFGQDYDAGKMIAPFDLLAGDDVRVILSNWSPDRRSSSWVLTDASIVTVRPEPRN